ncbi:type II secretion system F family protein [Actinokineospora auranticolor]|nr:type II secretion system F family protein [Actinokineospora auranticolor]
MPTSTALAAATGWFLLGPAGAISAALLAAITWHRHRAKNEIRTRLHNLDSTSEAIKGFVAELTAGAHPAHAAERAAEDATHPGAQVLQTLATSLRLGAPATEIPNAGLAHAWQLANRHGLPLADVLGPLADDLQRRARFGRQVLAKMAGARTSASILACLPLLGFVAGESVGAHPYETLAHTATGQILLATGAILACAGILWTNRLTEAAIT